MNRWIDENKMSRWKSIRIIDAEDLELWFGRSPSVALQFAQFIGKFPIKAKPLKKYWEEWFRSTEPGINETLLLEAGRNFHRQFSKFLEDNFSNYFEIKSYDTSLAIAYIYATISTLDNEILKESLFSRVVLSRTKKLLNNCLIPVHAYY